MIKALILTAALATLGLAGAAQAAEAPTAGVQPAKPRSACFFSRDWSNWRSPDDKTIYIRVNVSDIYRIDLASGSQLLTWPDSHLINEVRGSDSICNPIDLDLKVAQDGIIEPLFVKSITRLTREEAAAIPRKFRP